VSTLQGPDGQRARRINLQRKRYATRGPNRHSIESGIDRTVCDAGSTDFIHDFFDRLILSGAWTWAGGEPSSADSVATER